MSKTEKPKSKKVKGALKDAPVYVPDRYLMETIDQNLMKSRIAKMQDNMIYGNSFYVRDPMEPKDKGLYTFDRIARIADPSSRKFDKVYVDKCKFNIVQWIGHVHRLSSAKYAVPSQRLCVIPVSSIFPQVDDVLYDLLLRDTEVRDLFQRLYNVAYTTHIRLHLYVDMALADTSSLTRLLPRPSNTRDPNAPNMGTLYACDPHKAGRDFIVIAHKKSVLDECIEYGIRCMPKIDLITLGLNSTSKVKQHHLYRSWQKNCGLNSMAFALNPSTKLLKAYTKLCPIVVW